MKILELRDFGDKKHPSLILTTDSSIVRDNRPVFLPEISKRWRCDFMIGFLMCRLGKSISEKFAPRYYDMMTLCVRFVPLDIVSPNESSSENWSPWATGFDGALAIGTWIDVATIKSVDITMPQCVTFGSINAPISKAINILSKHMIIKTGDIVIPPMPFFSCDINIGDRIDGQINGQSVLHFNVK